MATDDFSQSSAQVVLYKECVAKAANDGRALMDALVEKTRQSLVQKSQSVSDPVQRQQLVEAVGYQLHADAMEGRIRLATTPSFNTRLVPRCVSAFLDHYPTIQVSVEELSAGQIARRIDSGHLDLGVGYKPSEAPELWFEPLYNEELKLVVAAGHPLARRRRVRMVELHHCRMVLLPAQFSTRVLLDDCFDAAGAEPRVAAELNSIAPMIELIRHTDLAGIIGATALSPSADLRIIPLEDPTPIRTPGLIWKKRVARSPMTRLLASIIRSASGDAGVRDKAG